MDKLWSIATLELSATDDELCVTRLLGDNTCAENQALVVWRLAVNQGGIDEEPTCTAADNSNIEDASGNEDTLSLFFGHQNLRREGKCVNWKVDVNTRKREQQNKTQL